VIVVRATASIKLDTMKPSCGRPPAEYVGRYLQFTTIPVCEPWMDEVTVSVAVTDFVPAVLRVTPNLWTPASDAVKV
jgi:hypothetical protein